MNPIVGKIILVQYNTWFSRLNKLAFGLFFVGSGAEAESEITTGTQIE